jgi:UTP--glucose-1-phosphate uridylyltransferase
MNIRKSVIPVAGFGTRMLPAAKAVPKEMLPVLDRPTIQYVVEESAAAGACDILLVTARDKRAIEDHFDRAPELAERLKSGGKQQLLAGLEKLCATVRLHSTRQPEPRGLGDAVAQARSFVGDEPFLCLLGDALFEGGLLPSAQLVGAHSETGTAVIAFEEVAPEKVDRYGIAAGTEIRPGLIRIERLVEKPPRDSAPSRLAIAARYLLTPTIFDCLARTQPGAGGEIQLTDALRLMLEREPIHGVIVRARRHDIGNPLDWLIANLAMARRDAALWRELEPALRRLLS